MNAITKTFLILLSLTPFAAGTFFPFASYRPPPPPRYRSARSSQNSFVPLQSSILGVRLMVPRALFDLFNVRPPYALSPPPPPVNYPRLPYNQPPYNPYNPSINFPPVNQFGAFSPNGYSNGRGFTPPISPTTFFNLMRAFYPNLIYRPDPRYPNVFAIRFPAEPRSFTPDFYRDPLPLAPQPPAPALNPEFDEEAPPPPNETEFFEPPLPSREFSPPLPPDQLPQQAPLQTKNQPLPFGRSSLPFNNNNNNSAQRRPPNHLLFIGA